MIEECGKNIIEQLTIFFLFYLKSNPTHVLDIYILMDSGTKLPFVALTRPRLSLDIQIDSM